MSAPQVLELEAKHSFASGFELDVSLRIGAGVTALCGPSGSGKTTVLSVIAGLLKPKSARVSVCGEVVADSARGVWVPPERRRVGIVFQDHLLFPHLSVRRNLLFGAPKGAGDASDALGRTATMLDLEGLLERMPATLSGGEKQRVAIGRALMSQPCLLLLDEPLNAQDPERRAKIRAQLARVFAETKLPVLLVSHDASEVGELAGSVLQTADGRMVGEAR